MTIRVTIKHDTPGIDIPIVVEVQLRAPASNTSFGPEKEWSTSQEIAPGESSEFYVWGQQRLIVSEPKQ